MSFKYNSIGLDKNSPLRSSLRKQHNQGNGNNCANRQKSPSGRKTVSFVSQNSDKKVSNVADCLQIMQHGTEMIKLRTNVRQFRRVFSLDADLSYVRWTPSNKKPHKARIAVDSIKEIRVGWNTELLRATESNAAGDIQEECAFSIIHGDDYECLDLIALSPGDANIWITGLIAISSGLAGVETTSAGGLGIPSTASPTPIGGIVANSRMANLRERWLASVFSEADTDAKGYVSEKTAVRLIRSINARLLTNKIKQKVKEVSQAVANEQLRGRIDVNQFVEIYKDIATRPEVYFLMVRYANKDYINCQDLQLFLETEQGISGLSADFCENIIDQCEPCAEAREHMFMTVDGFTNYLLSPANAIFDPGHLTVCQDMGQPFTSYFIATSYNTYLVEDQLKGPSSLDGYTSALKRNCRFIEIDLWEPSEEDEVQDEPLVHNGGNLWPIKLALSQVLDVINELAFERTRYPLFIRLEIHLSLEWQRILCELLGKHLGAKLYRPAEDPIDWTAPSNVPTPKKFQNKIILCGNRYGPSSSSRENGVVGEADDESGEVTEEDEGCDPVTGKPRRSDRRIKILRQLRDLIAPFAQSKQLRDPTHARGSVAEDSTLCPRRHVVSLSESTCLRMLHGHGSQTSTTSAASPDIPPFAQRYRDFLVRVTPNAARIDSSNLNPQEFWNFGLSLVALNYQTPGLMMDLQEGKFLANGTCGYVLKPSVMRAQEPFSPTDKLPTPPQVLHLKILSAQQLPRPRASTAKGDSADPFVVLEVFGVPADCAEERTKTVRNDSFNPTFDESFQFEITVPELALIRFLVLDDDYIGDDFIGQYTIPFDCLQSGYRHIPLLNNEGDPLENCTLFAHIAITNRRGGGKPKKRGLSVKRKMSRVQTGMKTVGVRAVDEQFKAAVSALVHFIEMRSQLESALTAWHEECGLGPTSTIRQGLRLVHSRLATAATQSASLPGSARGAMEGQLEQLQLQTMSNEANATSSNVPTFTIYKRDENNFGVRTLGQIPETMQKSFGALENLLKRCATITQSTDPLLTTLSETTKRISDSVGPDLTQLCTDAGLRGQKATRASENFHWNVKLCKAQITLMQTTLAEATDILSQVMDTAKTLGVLDEQRDSTSS